MTSYPVPKRTQRRGARGKDRSHRLCVTLTEVMPMALEFTVFRQSGPTEMRVGTVAWAAGQTGRRCLPLDGLPAPIGAMKPSFLACSACDPRFLLRSDPPGERSIAPGNEIWRGELYLEPIVRSHWLVPD